MCIRDRTERPQRDEAGRLEQEARADRAGFRHALEHLDRMAVATQRHRQGLAGSPVADDRDAQRRPHAHPPRKKKAPPERGLESGYDTRRDSGDRGDTRGLGTLRARGHFVADALAFLQTAEALRIDCGEMHEHVGTPIFGSCLLYTSRCV